MERQIQRIIQKYLPDAKPSGSSNIVASCPFHNTKSGRPLSMDMSTGLWICFSCGATGSIHQFLYGMGLDRHQVDKLVCVKNELPAISKKTQKKMDLRKTWDVLPEYVLTAYDHCPVQLLDAGFSMETLQENDVGFDFKEDRITFGIRDYLGRLTAVSGRSAQSWVEPRYKVYDSAFYDIVAGYEPKNRLHLYGMHTIYPTRYFDSSNQDPILIVEGYKGCLWARQLGFSDTIALQGSFMTEHQAMTLLRMKGPYYILLDNEPGKAFPNEKGTCQAVKIARRLSRSGRTYICQYEEGEEIGTSPDDLTKEQLQKTIEKAKTIGQYWASEPREKWSRKYNGIQ